MTIVATGCLPLSTQHQWHDTLYSTPPNEAAAFYRQRLGKPDFKMSMTDFVNRLDASPRRYTVYVRGTRIELSSYRDCVLNEFWRDSFHDEIWQQEGAIPYDPYWYQKQPYSEAELWVYDESRRFEHPKWGGRWICYVLPFKDRKCMARWWTYGEYGWRPDLFRFPDHMK